MRDGNTPFFGRMFELAMATFLVTLHPTIALYYLYYFSAFHSKYIRLVCITKYTYYVYDFQISNAEPRLSLHFRVLMRQPYKDIPIDIESGWMDDQAAPNANQAPFHTTAA